MNYGWLTKAYWPQVDTNPSLLTSICFILSNSRNLTALFNGTLESHP